RKAETAEIVGRRLPLVLAARPARRAEQQVEAAEGVDRALRVGDLARKGAAAETDALEGAAGMVRQHLPKRAAHLLAVGEPEKQLLDFLVPGEHGEDRVVGRGLRAVEFELLGGLAADVDRDRVRRRIGRQRRLE